VDYTIFIFLPLVWTLDLLTGHAWSTVERLMLMILWDPSPTNQLLPSNQRLNAIGRPFVRLVIAAHKTRYWAVTRKFYT
jgi:hypothetical protein